MSRNVLVVSTVEHGDDVLRAQIGDADIVKVVVPVVRQGVLDWLANDQEAISRAAIRDALATLAADEIVVAVRPPEQEGAVESAATDSAPHRSFDGVPVRTS